MTGFDIFDRYDLAMWLLIDVVIAGVLALGAPLWTGGSHSARRLPHRFRSPLRRDHGTALELRKTAQAPPEQRHSRHAPTSRTRFLVVGVDADTLRDLHPEGESAPTRWARRLATTPWDVRTCRLSCARWSSRRSAGRCGRWSVPSPSPRPGSCCCECARLRGLPHRPAPARRRGVRYGPAAHPRTPDRRDRRRARRGLRECPHAGDGRAARRGALARVDLRGLRLLPLRAREPLPPRALHRARPRRRYGRVRRGRRALLLRPSPEATPTSRQPPCCAPG